MNPRLVPRVTPLGVAAVLLVAAYLVLGFPDLQQAGSFFSSSAYQTQGEALAAASLLAWAVLAVIVVANLVSALHDAKSLSFGHRRQRALGYLAIGLIVLVMGITRHVGSTYSMTDGAVDEARQTAKLAK